MPLKAVKRAVVTSDCDSVVMISGNRMMLTLPSGSFPGVTYVLGSPSLATSTARPSGVNVSMSGSAPTVTTASSSPLVLKNATLPLAVFGAASTATATTPFRTVTLLTMAPYGSISISSTSVGFDGSEMLTISMVLWKALVMNRRRLEGS